MTSADRVPANFRKDVQEFLDIAFLNRNRNRPVAWLPRSPDLNPCVFVGLHKNFRRR